MNIRCSTGKVRYPTQEIAEEALIELWTKNEYATGSGPIAVYRCDDCGDFHFTSRPPMNNALAAAIKSKSFAVRKQAQHWESRFKKK